MAIVFSCECCGQRFRAKDEHAGKRPKCPVCGERLTSPSQAARKSQASPTQPLTLPRVDPDGLVNDLPSVTKTEAQSLEPHSLRDAASSSARRNNTVFWIGGTAAILVFIGFIGGVAWRARSPVAALGNAKGALQGAPEVRAEGSYEIISVNETLGVPVIDVRLNTKVSKEVLEEIALELKPKSTTGSDPFFIYYYLPGTEPARDRRRENRHPWGVTLSYPAFRTRILGLTIQEERRLRNQPLTLPEGSQALGTWLSEDWIQEPNVTLHRNSGLSDDEYNRTLNAYIDSHRLTIYRNSNGKWRVLFDGDEKPTPLVLKETPSTDGVSFDQGNGWNRYVVDRQGKLRVYSKDGELMSAPEPIKPTVAPTRGVTEKEIEGIDGVWVEIVKRSP